MIIAEGLESLDKETIRKSRVVKTICNSIGFHFLRFPRTGTVEVNFGKDKIEILFLGDMDKEAATLRIAKKSGEGKDD